MLPFWILSTLAIACTVRAAIPIDNLNITIIPTIDNLFQKELLESLQSTENFFKTPAFDVGTQLPIIALSYVQPAAALIPAVIGALAFISDDSLSEDDSNENLLRVISDVSQREIVKNDYIWMKSKMNSIQDQFELLPMDDLNRNEQIVYSIHFGISEMIRKFSDIQSLQRKYPLIGVQSLLGITAFFGRFYPIEKTFYKEIARNSSTSCILRDALEDYRRLATFRRLQYINDYIDYNPCVGDVDFQTSSLFSNTEFQIGPIVTGRVMGFTYKSTGYINNRNIQCNLNTPRRVERRVVDGANDVNFTLFYDNATEMRKFYQNTDITKSCSLQYYAFTRSAVENSFENSIKVADEICTDVKGTRTKTGFGWWTVIFTMVFGVNDIRGAPCDDTIGDSRFCDPYVKLFIDGRQQFKTTTKSNCALCNYNEMFVSRKIKKTSSIKFEVWDSDTGFLQGGDDLMLEWSTDINSHLNHGCTDAKNQITPSGITDYDRANRNCAYTYSNGRTVLGGANVTAIFCSVSFWKDEYN